MYVYITSGGCECGGAIRTRGLKTHVTKLMHHKYLETYNFLVRHAKSLLAGVHLFRCYLPFARRAFIIFTRARDTGESLARGEGRMRWKEETHEKRRKPRGKVVHETVD